MRTAPIIEVLWYLRCLELCVTQVRGLRSCLQEERCSRRWAAGAADAVAAARTGPPATTGAAGLLSVAPMMSVMDADAGSTQGNSVAEVATIEEGGRPWG